MGNAFFVFDNLGPRCCNAGSHAIGNTVGGCGCVNAVGFDNAADAVIRSGKIEPWPARKLIRVRLEHQASLAKSSPLRTIAVRAGFEYVSRRIGKWVLKKEDFLRTMMDLLKNFKIPVGPDQTNILKEIFDSMDFDENEELSLGEWAGGLTVFFHGTADEKSTALFQLLDKDGNGSVSKSELREYVAPLVKAMTPPEAAALRPLLIAHATDIIFNEVDLNANGKLDSSEFNIWRRDHSLVDELVTLIESEVYKVWLNQNRIPGNAKQEATSIQMRIFHDKYNADGS